MKFTPADVIMECVILEHKESTKEEWQEFAEKLMIIANRTHTAVVELKQNKHLNKLGEHMWKHIFEPEE